LVFLRENVKLSFSVKSIVLKYEQGIGRYEWKFFEKGAGVFMSEY